MQKVYSVKVKFIDGEERKSHSFDLDWRAYDFGEAVNFVEGLCTEMCVALTMRTAGENLNEEGAFYDWVRGVENRRFLIIKHIEDDRHPVILIDVIRSNQINYEEVIEKAKAYNKKG